MSKYEPANQINSLIRSILLATAFDVFAGNKHTTCMKCYHAFLIDVLLTVHLSIILVINQLDAQNLVL